MATPTSPQSDRQPVRDWPLYWFAALENAVEAGDREAAAKARAELRRVGVTVHFTPTSQQEAGNAS
jgi:hypothetical protein